MKPKKLPRLWCALQGLLPFDACLAAQHGELAWPGGINAEDAGRSGPVTPTRVPRKKTGKESR